LRSRSPNCWAGTRAGSAAGWPGSRILHPVDLRPEALELQEPGHAIRGHGERVLIVSRKVLSDVRFVDVVMDVFFERAVRVVEAAVGAAIAAGQNPTLGGERRFRRVLPAPRSPA